MQNYVYHIWTTKYYEGSEKRSPLGLRGGGIWRSFIEEVIFQLNLKGSGKTVLTDLLKGHYHALTPRLRMQQLFNECRMSEQMNRKAIPKGSENNNKKGSEAEYIRPNNKRIRVGGRGIWTYIFGKQVLMIIDSSWFLFIFLLPYLLFLRKFCQHCTHPLPAFASFLCSPSFLNNNFIEI